jgi:hypothetical protein
LIRQCPAKIESGRRLAYAALVIEQSNNWRCHAQSPSRKSGPHHSRFLRSAAQNIRVSNQFPLLLARRDLPQSNFSRGEPDDLHELFETWDRSRSLSSTTASGGIASGFGFAHGLFPLSSGMMPAGTARTLGLSGRHKRDKA